MFSRFEFEIIGGLPVRTLSWLSPQSIRVDDVLLGVGTSVVIHEGGLPFLDSVDSLRVIAGGPTELRYLDEAVLPIVALPAQSKAGLWITAAVLLALGWFGIRRRGSATQRET